MLLQSKDGILCDICGQAYKDSFVYYSFESTKIVVNDSSQNISHQNKDLDIDVCEKCYTVAEDKVRKNLASKPNPNMVKCDFCTNLMHGVFVYHRMLIHKVVVDKDQKSSGPAFVQTNYMDFNIDDQCFGGLTNIALDTRQKAKETGVWQ